MAARLARQATLRADVSAALSEERELQPMLSRCCEAIVDNLDVAFARLGAPRRCDRVGAIALAMSAQDAAAVASQTIH